jgi:hypothetical protein
MIDSSGFGIEFISAPELQQNKVILKLSFTTIERGISYGKM